MLAVSFVVFALVSLSPIDPVQANVGQAAYVSMSEAKRAQLAAYWGAGTPLLERYVSWLFAALQGDWGTSLRFNAPVASVIATRATSSLLLMAVAWAASGAIGFLLGIVAGACRGRWPDKVVKGYCFVLASTPTFWLGLVALMVFSVWLGWFPLGFSVPLGVAASDVTVLDALHHVALPALVLSLTGVANVALHTREKLVDVLESDYVRFARARGLSTAQAVRRHGLRNVALPALTLQFASISEIFGGSVLVEQVFSYPGLGQAAVTAGLGGDAPLLAGIAVASAALVFGGNLTANVLYGAIDPRMRAGRGSRSCRRAATSESGAGGNAIARAANGAFSPDGATSSGAPASSVPAEASVVGAAVSASGASAGGVAVRDASSLPRAGTPVRPGARVLRAFPSAARAAAGGTLLHAPRAASSNRLRTLVVCIASAVALVAIVAAGIAATDAATAVDFTAKNLAPSAAHLFGTDWMGRDMLARTLSGLSTSVLVGLVAAGVSSLIAVVLGAVAALGGPRADAAVSWLIDLVMGVPHIVLLVLISYALGKGFWGVAVGVAVTHWPSLTRVIRAEILQCRQSDFVTAARRLGASPARIALRHMAPAVLPQYLVGLILMFPHAILHEASITFLGFGLPPEMPAIGVILSEAMGYLSAGMWWLAVFPGLALVGVVLLFDAAGNGLRRLVDPHTSQE